MSDLDCETNLREPQAMPAAEAGHYRDFPTAAERALVALAMGLPCWLAERPDGFALLVDESSVVLVRDQLEQYERESLRWPPRPASPPTHRGPAAVPAFALPVFAAFLIAVFLTDLRTGLGLTTIGSLDALAVTRNGAWWRIVTSLTLHADIPHLLGNIVAGGFFVHFVARRFGSGVAWFLVLAAGALGNLLTVLVFAAAGHLAVGASTAVFGALGLLAGARLRSPAGEAAARSAGFSRRTLLPLGAACVLLALLGAGGERVDVVAHLLGFGSGLAIGLLAGGDGVADRLHRFDRAAALGTLMLPGLCWAAALYFRL
jgi:membrane associated rhomboid family serine protease